jgi:predicted GIY-YIG superfamily endonuclease/ribosomal protein L37AE/L43A
MVKKRSEWRKKGYWNSKENCQKVALKYSSILEFRKNNRGAYESIRRNGWEDLYSHMDKIGTHFKRCIYAYEFSDKSVYVGLTYNAKVRNMDHMKNKSSLVYKHLMKTGLNPNHKILTGYFDKEIAIEKEESIINDYKIEGWNILNKNKAGGLGGGLNRKWTKQKIKEAAKKYYKRYDFFLKDSSAYNAAFRKNWLDEVCSHMEPKRTSPGYWTKEKCKKEAAKFSKRKDFKQANKTLYCYISKKGWLDEVCSHMERLKPKGYWNLNNSLKEAAKYKNAKDFSKNSSSAYQFLIRNKHADKIVYKPI